MNQINNISPAAAAHALERRFALRLAAGLNESALQVGPDIGERLRVGREQALERGRLARAAQARPAPLGVTAAGALLWGRGIQGWGLKLGALLPAVALFTGLLLIQKGFGDDQIAAAAEIDAALLADDLPPIAYADAGFIEFLKKPRD